MRFRRCTICDAIAMMGRTSARGEHEYACEAHASGDGWAPVCSVDGCERPPKFRVDYRASEKRARMNTCPGHFQILPDDMSEVFRMSLT